MSIAENFSSSKNRVLDQIDTKPSINKITFKKKKKKVCDLVIITTTYFIQQSLN